MRFFRRKIRNFQPKNCIFGEKNILSAEKNGDAYGAMAAGFQGRDSVVDLGVDDGDQVRVVHGTVLQVEITALPIPRTDCAQRPIQ
jgi:hypothetical protein